MIRKASKFFYLSFCVCVSVSFQMMFRGGEKAPQKTTKECIDALKNSIRLLDERENLLNKRAEKSLQRAKDYAKTHQRRSALIELRKRKILEMYIEKGQNSKLVAETILLALEDTEVTNNVIASLNGAKDKIQKLNPEKLLERADTMMQDLQTSFDNAANIAEVLKEPLGQVVDDADLERELDELMASPSEPVLPALASSSPIASITHHAPAVPSSPASASVPSPPIVSVAPAPVAPIVAAAVKLPSQAVITA